MLYKAFISYSRAADGAIASALRSELCRFARPWHQRRAMRVFLDKNNLGASSGLWSSIQRELNESEYLIVLASPSAGRSPWVAREVAYWLTRNDHSRMLLVLTAGKIAWSDERADFDWDRTDALPKELGGVYAEQPRFVDLSWARSETVVDAKDPRFQEAIAELASCVRGVTKDELIGEDLRLHRRAILLARGAGTLLLLLAVLAVIAAVVAMRYAGVAERSSAESKRQQKVAEEQAALAKQSAREAERQTILANEKTQEARKQTAIANQNAAEAQRQTRIAREQTSLAQKNALEAQLQSEVALSRELSAHSSAMAGDDAELALLLAVEAVKVRPTREAEQAVRQAALRYPLRAELSGHTGEVTDAMFNADGNTIMTISADLARGDSTARVWESRSGKLKLLLGADGVGITAAAFSPTGHIIATGDGDNTVRIRSAETGRVLRELRGHDQRIAAVAFSHHGDKVATGSFDGTARVWATTTGATIAVLRGHSSRVTIVAFDPNDRYVLTAGSDTARLWRADASERVWELHGHSELTSAEFSADGSLVLTSSMDGTARIWETASGRELKTLTGHGASVYHASFSVDGTKVVTTGIDGLTAVWSTSTGAQITAFGSPTKGMWRGARTARFSPDGQRIVTAYLDQNARVWQQGSRAAALNLPGRPKGGLIEAFGMRNAVFSRDGNSVLSAGGLCARLWAVKEPLGVISLDAGPGDVQLALFSPDGTMLLTGSLYHPARLWDGTSGEQLCILRNAVSLTSAAFSPDRRYLVAGTRGGEVLLWDLTKRPAFEARGSIELEPLHTRRAHSDAVHWVAFEKGGERFVTASGDRTAQVWETRDAVPRAMLKGHKHLIVRASFSPDGQRILTAAFDGTARLWNAETGRRLKIPDLKHSDDVLVSADYSPNGEYISTVQRGGIVRIWRAATGDLIHQEKIDILPRRIVSLESKQDLMLVGSRAKWLDSTETEGAEDNSRVALSADGEFMVAAKDGKLGLWLTATGKLTSEFEGRANTVSIRPDGKRIVIAGDAGSVRFYPWEQFASFDQVLQVARARTSRQLTRDERIKYLHQPE